MPSAFRRAGRSRVAPSASANDASSSSTSASPLSSPLVSKQRQQQEQQEQQEQFSSSSSSASMLRGVKPWQGGSYRTSVGLNDLDAILGGGQVLGTTVFLEEDRLWTRDLAHTLVRYWCAEALSQEQQLLAPVVQCTNDNESGDDGDDGDDDDDPSSLPSWLKEDGFGFEDGDYLSNHRLLREELHHLLLSLPRNLHWDKQKKRAENKAKQEEKAKQEAAASSLSGGLGSLSLEPMAILEEDEEEDDNDDNNDNNESKNKADADADDGLKVAWQYKTSVQQERLAKARSEMSSSSSLSSSSSSSSFATTDVFCHSYDLSGRMNDQNPIDLSRHVSTLSLKRPITGSSNNTTTTTKNNYNNNGGGGGHGHHARGYRLFSQLVRLLTTESSSSIAKASLSASASGHHPTRAVRLLLYRPPLDLLAVALPLLVAHIREKSLPVVLLVCATPNANADDLRWKLAISRSCDVVLSTEGFAARHEFPPPAEFRHLKGVLKIARVDSKTRKRTELQASIYGFQRDRRKLHVPLLHIPPEDYAEGGGSVSGGVRSGAGRPLGYYDEGSGDSSNNSNSRPKPRGGGGGMGCSSNISGSLLDF
mmetsp:Transcript_3250/g.7837  ORF Transcript_3250/g.7837 Transcript_3250/m.7837 type:complete len:593 (-) Transcript_3250:749-2527(-)